MRRVRLDPLHRQPRLLHDLLRHPRHRTCKSLHILEFPRSADQVQRAQCLPDMVLVRRKVRNRVSSLYSGTLRRVQSPNLAGTGERTSAPPRCASIVPGLT